MVDPTDRRSRSYSWTLCAVLLCVLYACQLVPHGHVDWTHANPLGHGHRSHAHGDDEHHGHHGDPATDIPENPHHHHALAQHLDLHKRSQTQRLDFVPDAECEVVESLVSESATTPGTVFDLEAVPSPEIVAILPYSPRGPPASV